MHGCLPCYSVIAESIKRKIAKNVFRMSKEIDRLYMRVSNIVHIPILVKLLQYSVNWWISLRCNLEAVNDPNT